MGRRIEKHKQHIQAGRSHYTETTQYGWDGDTLAYESTNLYTKHYVYENGSFVPLIQATYRQQINQHQTPQWTNQYDYDKDPLWHTEQKANSFDRVWFYHCDYLGTLQEMSDQTGTIVWSANYKAWGECKTENHTKRDIWDSEIITNNIRFQGQYFDDETGLHYNRFRYYSPYVGRFISKDPIGLLGGFNKFTYAANPIGWLDPYGLTGVDTTTYYHAGKIIGDIDPSKGKRNKDFNPAGQGGFYVTKSLAQAKKWQRARNLDSITKFEVPNTELKKLDIKSFSTKCEWKEFVLDGRSGTLKHHYDGVEGGMFMNPDAYKNQTKAKPVEMIRAGHQLAIFSQKGAALFTKYSKGTIVQ